MEFICNYCGNNFKKRGAYKKYTPKFCSAICYGKSMEKPKKCLNCDNIFVNYKNDKFCGMKCSAEYKTGKELSSQHRRSLSEAKIGKPIPHLHTEEVRKSISKSLTGKPQPWMRGENHPNYKDGGKAHLQRQKDMGRVEYKNWRRAVFERDNYTCQICGLRGVKIQADHIKSYSEHKELRYDINNGRTLCVECHRKTPNYGGRNKNCKQEN